MASSTPKLLYVVNIPRFFVSHRLSLALAAQQDGFEVHVATSDHDSENVQRIIDSGLIFHPLPLSQHGTSPLQELRTLNAIRRLYRTLKPDLVHHVSIKPVIYGGIAAKLTRRKAVVNAMSGLGYVFIGTGLKPRLLRLLTRPAFKFAMRGENTQMIFQNPDDQQVFVDNGLVNPEQGVLIRGSGVDEHHFAATDENMQGLPVVLFAGRLLWQKGIGEFAEVARRLQGKARFIVYGYEEATSPLNVPASQLQEWQEEGILEWGGKRDDMPNAYAEANIICLPSTYGEGVPKVLIEAASCARACVTTDTAGCREIVHDQKNGLIVPPNDLDALTSAIDDLITHPEKRQQMGLAGRQLVLEHFTFTQVADETFKLYRTLLTQ